MKEYQKNLDTLDDYTKVSHANMVNNAHKCYGEQDMYDNPKDAASKWLGMTKRKTRQDHADDTADKFIGGELWVKPGTNPVTTYSSKEISPTRSVKTYKPGQFIGIVYSYVTNPAMFMTEDNQFVPIETSTFDREKMDASLVKKKAAEQAVIDSKTQARKEENYKTNSLYALGTDTKEGVQKVTDAVGSALSFGGNFLKYGLILTGAVVLFTFYSKYSK